MIEILAIPVYLFTWGAGLYIGLTARRAFRDAGEQIEEWRIAEREQAAKRESIDNARLQAKIEGRRIVP